MHPLDLTGNYRLAAGIFLGFLFGFLLVASGMAWRKSFQKMFFFKNGDFLKTFLFSLAAGIFFFYFANKIGLVNIHFRPSSFWCAFTGGILCGTGIAICGQIPCTSVCLFASGRIYALCAIAGMLLAIPAARMISGLIKHLNGFSAPFDFHHSLSGYASTETVVLWVAALCAIFSVFVHLVLRGDSEG